MSAGTVAVPAPATGHPLGHAPPGGTASVLQPDQRLGLGVSLDHRTTPSTIPIALSTSIDLAFEILV
jgi:hypothetical protein